MKLRDRLVRAQVELAEAVEIMENQDGDYDLLCGCRMLEGVLSDKLFDEPVCPECLSKDVARISKNEREWLVEPKDKNYWYSVCMYCDYEWEEEV